MYLMTTIPFFDTTLSTLRDRAAFTRPNTLETQCHGTPRHHPLRPMAFQLFSQRDEIGIVLVPALVFEKVVVAAVILLGVVAAGRRAVLIGRAAAFHRIEELAGALVDRVLAVAQHAMAVALDVLGEFLFGLLVGQAEAAGQALDVALGHQNPIVGATIGRAFRAVVARLRFLRGENGQFFFRHGR